MADNNTQSLDDNFFHNLFTKLESKSLIIKQAAIQKTRREYFKEKDFEKWLKDESNQDFLIQECNNAFYPKLKKEKLMEQFLQQITNSKYVLNAYSNYY